MRMKIAIAAAVGLCVIIGSFIPVGGRKLEQQNMKLNQNISRIDLSPYSSAAIGTNLDLLFIHHSCGGQWFAPVGPDNGTNCIYTSHPNGGNLRALLEKSGYKIHEASYGSRVGQNTDIFDWLPKFQTQMDDVLRCDSQDTSYTGNRRNQVVMFKPCFPNNAFRSAGQPPGNSSGPELSVWNAKAAYTALLPEFRKHPDVLFICVSAPPLAPGPDSIPLWKHLAGIVKRRLRPPPYDLAASGPLARQFNNWLSDSNGWLKGYSLTNVVVFDYYDVLTDSGDSDFSRHATWNGNDSHPSREGNEKAAQAFVPFLNQAVRRAGLAQ